MTDFFDAVDSRRSIRAFLPDAVPPATLDRCLDAALKAPSTSNLQPWRFVLLQSPEARAGAVKVCLGQAPAASAPLLVALVCAPDSWRRNRDEVVRILTARGDLRKGLDNECSYPCAACCIMNLLARISDQSAAGSPPLL